MKPSEIRMKASEVIASKGMVPDIGSDEAQRNRELLAEFYSRAGAVVKSWLTLPNTFEGSPELRVHTNHFVVNNGQSRLSYIQFNTGAPELDGQAIPEGYRPMKTITIGLLETFNDSRSNTPEQTRPLQCEIFTEIGRTAINPDERIFTQATPWVLDGLEFLERTAAGGGYSIYNKYQTPVFPRTATVEEMIQREPITPVESVIAGMHAALDEAVTVFHAIQQYARPPH